MWLIRFATSSIGGKVFMAATGIFLLGFLVGHLIGNILIFIGPGPFNRYSDALIKNPLIVPIELILLAIFFAHIYFSIVVTTKNKKAKPYGYIGQGHPEKKSRKTLASGSMIITGVVVLAFVVFHVVTMKYGEYIPSAEANVRDLFALVVKTFTNPVFVFVYVLAVLILGLHLSHAIESALQTLGIDHGNYIGLLSIAAKIYTVVVTLGFCLLPLFIFLQREG